MTAPTGQERTYQLGAVLPHVRGAAELVGKKFGVQTILGWRATARDMTGHPAGLALDYMCSPSQGDSIASFMQEYHEPLAVKYLIWKQRIWEPGGDWEPMEDRGSPTQNHMDHVHAQFKIKPGSGSTGEAGLNDSFLDRLNPLAGWSEDATTLGMKLLAGGTAAALVVLGLSRTVSGGSSQ
jgi:hypothetical protein